MDVKYSSREMAMKEALEFARGAIQDAISLEDGLDGSTGIAVIKMIDAALQPNAAWHDSHKSFGRG